LRTGKVTCLLTKKQSRLVFTINLGPLSTQLPGADLGRPKPPIGEQ